MKKTIALLFFAIILVFITACSQNNLVTVIVHVDDREDNISLTRGETLEQLDNPTKDGFSFFGWYIDADFSTPFDFSLPIESNTDIYARFSLFPLGEENYFSYQENGLWGFLLPNGEKLVEAKYDTVVPFRYGLAMVIKDNQFTYINTIGEELGVWFDYYPILYNHIIHFTDEMFSIIHNGSQTLIIDNELQTVTSTSAHFTSESYFENGFAPVNLLDEQNQISEYCGYIDATGNIFGSIGNYYTECTPFNEGYAFVKEENNGYYLIDTHFDKVLTQSFDFVIPMFDGMKSSYVYGGKAIVHITSLEGSYYAVIDISGAELITFTSEIPVFADDSRIVTRNSNWMLAIYDYEGTCYSAYEYYNGYLPVGIFDGMLIVRNSFYQYGALNEDGELVIPLMYQSLSPFEGSVAAAKLDNFYGIIDISNHVLVEFKYTDLKTKYQYAMEYPYIG
ncbi:MAG: WG repeat-containing protein [Candidatus Izemoplasmatales bacterium]